MEAIAWIIERFNWLTEYFYKAYVEINDLPYPFWLAAWPFWLAAEACSHLAQGFYDFYYWVDYVEQRVRDLLTWPRIWDTLLTFLPNLRKVDAWFNYWYEYVWGVITDWWGTITTTFEALINEVRQWAKLWIDYLQDQVTALGVRIDDVLALIPDISDIQVWFTDWTGNVGSVITDWWTGALSEVQSLINSAFIEREPFWSGWQDWRDKVTEFFTDPEDWLYKSLDRIIERFW